MLNNYNDKLDFYTDQLSGTGSLAFQDLQEILAPQKSQYALDFGCGAGRSSKVLKDLGYSVIGVDINIEMLNAANDTFGDEINFFSMKKNIIPFKNDQFDIVFNSFVMLEMQNIDMLIANFKEMRRVCKSGGRVVTITNSDFLFIKKWKTINNNFKENKDLFSGKIVKIELTDANITLFDYYWSEKDYLEALKIAGFKKIHMVQPLANKKAGKWMDEVKYPPYSIYICEK